MSSHKNSFSDEYTVVEVIKTKKDKKTSIVKNSKGEHFIAKKFYMTDSYAMHQIGLMKTIRHPNIVAFHDIFLEKGRIYLIEEYCEEGDLAYHISRQIKKKQNNFSEAVIAKWLLQLLLALQYLHNKKIMHRDIRPENIFLTSQGNLKLGCFRSSKLFDQHEGLSETLIDSSYYLAPECIENEGYDEKVDIWAFGNFMYELCSLKPMVNPQNFLQQANLILEGNIRPLPKIYSRQLHNIYERTLAKDYKLRPSARQLLREQYFMEKMRNFISEKVEVSKIPIKYYQVHLKLLANKKKKPKVSSFHKQEVRNNKLPVPMLPLIQDRSRETPKQSKSDRSVEKCGKGKMNEANKSIQKIRDRSRSRDLNRKPIKSIEKASPINLQGRKNSISKKSPRPESLKKQQVKLGEKAIETPKKMLPPPILPKPPAKKFQKKQAQKQPPEQKTQASENLSNTMKSSELSPKLQIIRKSNEPQKWDSSSIKDSINKVFEDLNIKQEEEYEFQFELEQDEDLARLTHKKEGNQLIETYTSKLAQLIDEINHKYSPHMEPIQERTQQFDSNTFAKIIK